MGSHTLTEGNPGARASHRDPNWRSSVLGGNASSSSSSSYSSAAASPVSAVQNNRLLPPISQILNDNAPAFTQAQSYYSSAPQSYANTIAPGDLEDVSGSLTEMLHGNNPGGYVGTGARSSESAGSSNSIGDDGYFASRGSSSGYLEGTVKPRKKANYNALGLGVPFRGHKLARNGFIAPAPAPLATVGHMSCFERDVPLGDSTAFDVVGIIGDDSSSHSSGFCAFKHDMTTLLSSPDGLPEDSGVSMNFVRDVLATAPDFLGDAASFGDVDLNVGFGIEYGLGLYLDGNGGNGVNGVGMGMSRSSGPGALIPPLFAPVPQVPVSMTALGGDLDSGENDFSSLP